ncbi:hypothetical protein CONLIGDRAFT_627326 [Coniochaeta ligniaria NRRL 30616]|uniref:Uncharacterized protein n=1 Tax=Coniochaeta ligniaria NRRL 30616 TaxID=1408157 RepID=A0A1J7K0N3_9PEZI|nr:hypothetical protein CONLIGDRAFT_627326 [Coniochaeta ligniaria NRRL 30616]
MFVNLRKHFSPKREKTDKPLSTPTSIESSSNSINNTRPLNHPLSTPQQAPLARGVEVTSCYIDGQWNFNSVTNLQAAQIKAVKQARRSRTPVPDRKPYSLVAGGHHETIAWVSEPSNPETLERLFAIRDEAERQKNARFVHGFNLTRRTLSEPEEEHQPEATTQSTDAGSSTEDQGNEETQEITQAGSTDTPEEDAPDTVSRWSYSSSDSDDSSGTYGSDDSFEDWANGDNDDDSDFDRDRVSDTSDDEAAPSPASHEGEQASPPRGTTSSELDTFVKAWHDNIATHSGVTLPPLRHDGKCHYTSAAASRRFDYIKSYLSLRESMRPINIFLLLIHYRRSAACDAARRNPAFLRAALDIDWDGIIDELPPRRHKNDSLQMYNKHVIRTWFDCGGYIFTEPDPDGVPVIVFEDAESAELSWPELLAREDLEGPCKRWYDSRVNHPRLWMTLNGLETGHRRGRRKWQKPGSSKLGSALTASE